MHVRINSTFRDNAVDLNIVMLMYNLLKYNYSCSILPEIFVELLKR